MAIKITGSNIKFTGSMKATVPTYAFSGDSNNPTNPYSYVAPPSWTTWDGSLDGTLSSLATTPNPEAFATNTNEGLTVYYTANGAAYVRAVSISDTTLTIGSETLIYGVNNMFGIATFYGNDDAITASVNS